MLPRSITAALIETPGSPTVPGERPEPTRGEGEVLVSEAVMSVPTPPPPVIRGFP